MNISKKLFSTYFYLALFASLVIWRPQALEAAAAKISWTDCLNLFKSSNPDLRKDQLEVRSVEHKLKAAHSTYWPQINLNANAPLASSTTNTNKELSFDLNLTQQLFSGFATQAQVAEAEANLTIILSQQKQNESDLIYQLRKTFLEIVFNQKNLRLSQDIILRRQQNFDMVKLRYSNGKENKGSVLLAEAYLHQAQFEKLQSENLLSTEIQKIKNLIPNMPGNFELADDLHILPQLVLIKDLKFEIQNHPEFLIANAQKQSTEAQLKSQKSAFYPDLNLRYNHDQDNNWSTGVNLSWNLFNGSKDYHLIQSQIELQKIRDLEIEAIQNDLLEKLMLAQNSLQESHKKFEVDTHFLKAALVREQISRSKYNNGLSNFDDWDQIQADLINRQKNLIKSEFEKLLHEAEWLKAQGKGTI